MTITALEVQYTDMSSRANRMRESVCHELSIKIEESNISLGVPMESRVKTWESIRGKIERKYTSIENVHEISDLIGIRAILLFKSDLIKLDKLINEIFDVVSSEDTSMRLDESQFGYQSLHYDVKLPKSWLSIPSMAELGDLQVEIQVRTLAQHMWAAASHKLQYKNETSVPPPVRRSINRVSALLETVDLEFERVLTERKEYREITTPTKAGSDLLNVDLLQSVLTNKFPPENKKDDEPYDELLKNLIHLSVNTVEQLENIIDRTHEKVMGNEEIILIDALDDMDNSGTSKSRLEKGVYFSHVGLARQSLEEEFGGAKLFDAMNSKGRRRRK